jgi:hypothetical protein
VGGARRPTAPLLDFDWDALAGALISILVEWTWLGRFSTPVVYFFAACSWRAAGVTLRGAACRLSWRVLAKNRARDPAVRLNEHGRPKYEGTLEQITTTGSACRRGVFPGIVRFAWHRNLPSLGRFHLVICCSTSPINSEYSGKYKSKDKQLPLPVRSGCGIAASDQRSLPGRPIAVTDVRQVRVNSSHWPATDSHFSRGRR